MEKLMERAVVVVNRSKRSGYRRNARAGSATGHYKICATPPKTKPDWILFGRPATYKNAAAQWEPRAIFSPPFRRFDLSRPLIYRPPSSLYPATGFRSDSTDGSAFTTDRGVVSRDEGRGPCSIGGTINRTSYLEQPSNLSFFAPNSFSRRRSWGCCGERRRFGNDFKN